MAAHYGRWQLISAEIWKSKGLLGRWKYLSSELLLSTNKHQDNSSPFHFLLTFKQAIPNSSRTESKHKSQTWLQDLRNLITLEKCIWQIYVYLRNTGRTEFTTMFWLAVVLVFQKWVEWSLSQLLRLRQTIYSSRIFTWYAVFYTNPI